MTRKREPRIIQIIEVAPDSAWAGDGLEGLVMDMHDDIGKGMEWNCPHGEILVDNSDYNVASSNISIRCKYKVLFSV